MKRKNRLLSVALLAMFAWALGAGIATAEEKIFSNSLGMRFVLVPAGEFMMGSHESAKSVSANPAYADEPSKIEWFQRAHPMHRVTISQPFYLQETEVSVGQFRAFVSDSGYRTDAEREGWGWVIIYDKDEWVKKEGANWRTPGFPQGDNEPVVFISWNDAAAFVKWLNNRENTGRYALPTEAQWEYACRAGTETPFYWGQLPDGKMANFADGNYSSAYPNKENINHKNEDGFIHTAPAGSYPANPFGLYDMSGNAYEWCSDWYAEYSSEPVIDPRGPSEGKFRVLRGGSWFNTAVVMRSPFRYACIPGLRCSVTGFRIARTY